ncbi:MAG: dephospho-CoA kinase [Bauldia sp.]|uniref:dephospho-CoA kinase n=1 Tax=Bauldia sp. TaxID=2575872 RepID=UPI001D21C605|nr:dephospho-CoA kinase [Bauldia sp.]MCB1498163.1 dephospho-CoA kinase [Bauldia sp.]
MLVLGLTGSAAMGKSTTAAMFAAAGLPVFDADRTVHRLYRGAAVPVVEAAFPGTTAGGAVDRDRLREKVLGNEAAMERLEALIHPLVRAERDVFLAAAAAAGHRAVVLDIPLLFETGAEGDMDAVIVVTTAPEIQMARMLARDGMTRERAEAMIARQTPDAEKRRRAHFLVDTSSGLEDARLQVAGILRAVAGMTGRQ